LTTLTLITVAVVVYGIIARNGYPRAMALAGATPIGAAVVAGDTAVPTFYAAAIGASAGIALRLIARTWRFQRVNETAVPAGWALLAFMGWSLLVTLLAPQIFHGTRVLESDGTEATLRAGLLTSSNLAQIVYLFLSVGVVFFLARSRWAGPEIIGFASGTVTMLSFWRYLSDYGLPFPVGVFDNSPGFTFIDSAPGGAERFRGIFSEPSGLAIASLVTIAYMASRAAHVDGWRRLAVLAVMAIAAFLASISTSATFVVASVVLCVIVGVTILGRWVLKRHRVSPLVITALCALAIAAVWVLPFLANMIEQVVNDKVASSSFEDRSGADSRSFEIALETFGFGVGLGSHRPSSFLAGLLSTTGLIGTVLFTIAVATLMIRAYPLRRYRPVFWALLALLLTKVVASPDLADTSGILWLSLGVLAHGVLQAGKTTTPLAHHPVRELARPDAPRHAAEVDSTV
jgi:hypothetical protein